MPLLANVGVPMLMVQMPLMMGALPAVIFIEAYLVKHWYALGWPKALRVVTLANVLSTVLGFPLMWFALMMAQSTLTTKFPVPASDPWHSIYSVTVKAPWLDPLPGQGYWMIPTACLVLLIPAFFMTVLVESMVYRRAFAPCATRLDPMRATWRMHCFSYGFLAIAGLFLLAGSLVKHHRIQEARHAPASNTGRPGLPSGAKK
jgi:hypothetical protein